MDSRKIEQLRKRAIAAANAVTKAPTKEEKLALMPAYRKAMKALNNHSGN